MPNGLSPSDHLLLTARGEQWLLNFDEADRAVARELAAALVLVSHNEFERGLATLVLEMAHTITGPVALYGAREIDASFQFGTEGYASLIDATPRGTDIGSEGRLANIIRNIALAQPSKFLNHPNVDELRTRQVDAVFVLDDFIGSGKRSSDYLTALWQSRSLRSWTSYKRIRFDAVAYSGTAAGVRCVERHPAQPAIHIVRHSPTITALHWKSARIEAARKMCRKYAKQASLKGPSLGFRDSESLLVFEHGCPNNAPAIFWAPSKKLPDWTSLFPAKRIDVSTTSAFPGELVRRDPVHALLEAGQRRLASALASNAHRPLTDQEALTLALFSKGQNRVETIASATGLSAKEAHALIEHCIAAGWISARRRITDKGRSELRGMRTSLTRSALPVPDLGKDEYYPTALRDHGHG
ncbi:MAG: hypothetical protein EOP24_21395 [Hyphomicrobiales bacterium]|nr:MAG: hypothetical protein EOP24_21395 [Hyphomicrobiales bacterium]